MGLTDTHLYIKTIINKDLLCSMGFPGGSVEKNLPAMKGSLLWVQYLGRFPWKRKWQPTSVFLPGEFHGQKCLVDYSPWGCKQLDTTEHACIHSYFKYCGSLMYIIYTHVYTHTHTPGKKIYQDINNGCSIYLFIDWLQKHASCL